MCGIAGIWNRDGRSVDPAALRTMNVLQAHRGPDGAAVLVEGSIGFAHRRLAIVDASDRSAQPMVSDDGRFVLLFNGEIHNFLELRSELEGCGHSFRSAGDTEVVLHSYRKWGTGCFARFNGMWALALWERPKRRLLLSRDRFGIKPLYYSARGARFAFASEAKALAGVFPEERVVDREELRVFLCGGCPDDGGTRTFFANIAWLPPASWMVVDADGEPTVGRYWSLDPEPATEAGHPVEIEARFRDLLDDSVRLRMRSDAPVGICLSGGLDSSAVACLAARSHPGPLECFSLHYPDHPRLDESAFAAEVANSSDRFQVRWVRPRVEQLLPAMHRIVWHHDAPTPIRGRLGLWEIFGAASQSVRVALVGEGSDELLAGYSRFAFPFALDLLHGSGRHRLGPGLMKELFLLCSSAFRRPLQALREPLLCVRRSRTLSPEASTSPLSADFLHDPPPLPPSRFLHTWLRPDVERPFGSHLLNALWLDFRHAGLPELLHAGDALSMAFSLENRPPFLDHRVVEFCFSLPYHLRIQAGRTKSLLRRAMSGIVPAKVLDRRDKKGLPFPYETFFRRNLTGIREMLLDGTLVRSGIVHKSRLERILLPLGRRWRPVTPGLLPMLWRCATAELWFRQFIAGRELERPQN